MSAEPTHQAEWEAWQKASSDYERCRCESCLEASRIEDLACEAWLAVCVAKRKYVQAKEAEL